MVHFSMTNPRARINFELFCAIFLKPARKVCRPFKVKYVPTH